jgi:hypothetical protein
MGLQPRQRKRSRFEQAASRGQKHLTQTKLGQGNELCGAVPAITADRHLNIAHAKRSIAVSDPPAMRNDALLVAVHRTRHLHGGAEQCAHMREPAGSLHAQTELRLGRKRLADDLLQLDKGGSHHMDVLNVHKAQRRAAVAAHVLKALAGHLQTVLGSLERLGGARTRVKPCSRTR